MNNRQGTTPFQTQDQNKKRAVSLSTQAQTKTSLTTLHNTSSNDHPKCLFCKKLSAKDKPVCFPQMIKNALYTKYSSSQNYYYAKDINELLSNAKTPKVIKFKDHQCLDDEEEYLKRYYKRAEYEGKIKMLTEYYKFHKDISRMFMKPIVDVLNRHHDKKRRFEYIRVTKMLKEQNKLKNSPNKPLEKPKAEELRQVPITDRVLVDLDITTKKDSQKDEIIQDEVTETSRLINNYRIINTSSRDDNKTGSTFKPKLKLTEKEQSGDHGTLHELNMKLSEIITATHSRAAQMDFMNFFDNSVIKPNQNETITNLDKFLTYLQTNKEPSKPVESGVKVISLKRRQSGTRSTPKMRPTETEPQTQSQSQSIEKFASISNIYKAPAEAIIKMTPNKNGPKRPVSREDFQKAIQPELMRKKSRATVGTTIDDGRASAAEEKPVTVMALAKAVPYQTLASTLNNNKFPAANVSKIKNFEDTVKTRQQQGSPFKFLVQRSASREGLRQDHASYASRRFHEPSAPVQPEERTRGTPGSNTRRRKSFIAGAGDLSRSNIRVVAKDQSVYNIKNVEAQNVEDTNSHPNSHREMRITVDINSIGKGISQQEGFPNINGNPNTGKLSTAGGSRGHNGHSSASHNYAIKIVNQKAMLVQTNDPKDMASVPHSNQDLAHVKLGPGSNSNYRSTSTMRGENHSRQGSMRATPENAMINLKNNVERFYKKTTDQRMINFTGHRHLTKSEERMNKLDATVAKNTSVPYAKTYRNHEQTTTLEGSRASQEASHSVPRQIYTYNHNNIVNIYLNPQAEKIHTEAASGFNSGNNVQKGPVRPSEDIKASVRKLIDPNLLSRNILSKNTQNTMSQSQLKKSDSFYKDSKRYNSPLRVVKKDSIKLTHTKSGSLGTAGSILATERSSGQFKLL